MEKAEGWKDPATEDEDIRAPGRYASGLDILAAHQQRLNVHVDVVLVEDEGVEGVETQQCWVSHPLSLVAQVPVAGLPT